MKALHGLVCGLWYCGEIFQTRNPQAMKLTSYLPQAKAASSHEMPGWAEEEAVDDDPLVQGSSHCTRLVRTTSGLSSQIGRLVNSRF